MSPNDGSLDGVDLVSAEDGQLGKPTGNTAWCYECDSMMLEVRWSNAGETEWICFSTLYDIGAGIWKMDLNLYW